MTCYKVGIIGNGFVGESQAFAFSPTNEIRIYDIDPLKSTHTKEEIDGCDFIFVCVPTPMHKDGSQDISFIEKIFEEAVEYPIYIIKSTVLPGTTKRISKKYPHLNIVFSPEFLTERTAKLDMLTQARIIFGGEKGDTQKIKELYENRFKNRHIIETDSTTAELVKYMNNTFFATKVSILNEFKLLADKLGVNWEDALYGFASDGRIGDSHLHVPGPDGRLGYGGTCFPKDVNALITLAKELDTPLNTIEGGWKTNLTVRPEKDWEADKGRAVS
jgi:UDPglucose 6-dehydrogenase|tara:strand:+ start:492 stop:1313 length:822 start_codon:yes stop_codon:yes gene_type:complete